MREDFLLARARVAAASRKLVKRWRSLGRHYLARTQRATLPGVTFVGITGSAGKTTTKSLSALVLSTRGKCKVTPGTGNEYYAIERTILETTRAHRFAVMELSAGFPGYMDRSIRAVRPKIAVLTLVAREHYSAFGSIEAIAAEKGKLVAALPPDGVAVLNRDDPLVRAIGQRHPGRVVWVGRDPDATIRLLEARSDWPQPLTLRIAFEGRPYEVATELHGTHLAVPVLCALGVGIAAGIPIGDAVSALKPARPFQGRMQIESSKDGVVFLRDDCKAPHWSFDAPLEFLRAAQASRKIAVIGTISDAPRSPSRRYAQAAGRALEVAQTVVLVGVDARGALKAHARTHPGRLHAFAHVRDAADYLRAELRAGDLVLLKGTNKQDHLVRLVMDRDDPVHCWRQDCNRNEFCGACELARRPRDQGPKPARIEAAQAVGAADAAGSFVVAGLGNPGVQHRETPHNVGHLFVEALASRHGGDWTTCDEGAVCEIVVGEVVVNLLKPLAYVNRSGPVLRRYLQRTGRRATDCVVIHDDVDLALGTVRDKRDGSDGGHKGVRSIIDELETDAFARIRIGVRRQGDTRKAKELVLERFSKAEQTNLKAAFMHAEELVRAIVRGDPAASADRPRSDPPRENRTATLS